MSTPSLSSLSSSRAFVRSAALSVAPKTTVPVAVDDKGELPETSSSSTSSGGDGGNAMAASSKSPAVAATTTIRNSKAKRPDRFKWERVQSVAVSSRCSRYSLLGSRSGRGTGEFEVPAKYEYNKSTCENYSAAPEDGERCFGDFEDVRVTRDFTYHGTYTRERQLFQDKLVRNAVGASSRKEHPWIVFTAGAMGAGKSHTINWMSEMGCFPLPDIVAVDPDLFKTQFPEWREYCRRNPETAGALTRKESGYLVEIAQEVAMIDKKNVWVDGSLRDTEWYGRMFENIRKDYPEYRIAILYVYAREEQVLERARRRAEQTGRHVPVEEIKDSLLRVPLTVAKLTPNADFVAYIQNEGDKPTLTGFSDWSGRHRNVLGSWTEVRNRFATLPEFDEKSRWAAVVERNIARPGVLLFSKTYCSYSFKLKGLLRTLKIPYETLELDKENGGAAMQLVLASRPTSHCSTVPQLFASGEFIGGCSDALVLHAQGMLEHRLRKAAAEALPGGEASLPPSTAEIGALMMGLHESNFSSSRRRVSGSRHQIFTRSLSN